MLPTISLPKCVLSIHSQFAEMRAVHNPFAQMRAVHNQFAQMRTTDAVMVLLFGFIPRPLLL